MCTRSTKAYLPSMHVRSSALPSSFHGIQQLPLSSNPGKRVEEKLCLSLSLNKKRTIPVSSYHRLSMKHEESENSNSLSDNQRQQQRESDKDENTPKKDFFYIPETRILAGDICTILMACQLLGLVDVFNRPEFWANGGFNQPIGLGPPDPITGASTLVKLVQRDSVMSISWVLAALKNNGYDYAAIADNRSAVRATLAIFVDYCALLGLYTFGTVVWAKGGGGTGDVVEFIRQAWFTILMMGGFRVTYSQFNR